MTLEIVNLKRVDESFVNEMICPDKFGLESVVDCVFLRYELVTKFVTVELQS